VRLQRRRSQERARTLRHRRKLLRHAAGVPGRQPDRRRQARPGGHSPPSDISGTGAPRGHLTRCRLVEAASKVGPAGAQRPLALRRQKNQEQEKPAMSQGKRQSLQDTFLNSVRKTKTPLTIFLVNGVKLQGIVTWFDNF